VLDPVLPTDPVEQHLDRAVGVPTGEDLPLSVSTCCGTP
jgi:hypothetical protein